MRLEEVSISVRKGSRFFLYRVRHPPWALFVWRGRSGSNLSSEFRTQQYLSPKTSLTFIKSHWKIMGSCRKIKSGSSRSTYSFKSRRFLVAPSIFHVRHVSTDCWGSHEAELSLSGVLHWYSKSGIMYSLLFCVFWFSFKLFLCTNASAEVAKLSEHISLTDCEWRFHHHCHWSTRELCLMIHVP